MPRSNAVSRASIVAAALLALAATRARAQPSAAPGDAPDPTVDLFASKCASCHTIGSGKRVGPDLKGALDRRDRAWLERMIKAPSTLLDRDPIARQLVVEAGGVRMPDLGLSDAQSQALVALIERCSRETCNLQGKFVPVTQATEAEVARGRELFLGRQPLAGGGAPCLACHTVRGAGGGIGGGTLARDLTHAFGRLGDQGLEAALKAPAFPVMGRAFAASPLQPDEVFALRAFLHDANRREAPAETALSLPLFGFLGAGAVLAGLNAAWSRRLRGVRDPLVHREGNGRHTRGFGA